MITRALPFSAARGLNRIEAARYIGVSPGTLDKLIADGRMPQPKHVGARRVYDRNALDHYFDVLGSEDDGEKNDFDED